MIPYILVFIAVALEVSLTFALSNLRNIEEKVNQIIYLIESQQTKRCNCETQYKD